MSLRYIRLLYEPLNTKSSVFPASLERARPYDRIGWLVKSRPEASGEFRPRCLAWRNAEGVRWQRRPGSGGHASDLAAADGQDVAVHVVGGG
jgi:hypothetical protein